MSTVPDRLERLAVLGLLVLTASWGGSHAAQAQQVAGSVEAGLQTLAQEIVTKSIAADRNTIAVLPFPNADGSCSVLSTYLVDELILSLFSIPNSPISIVERSQLEAIINENQLGETILDPKTTQQLGDLSGVQALAVGTITQVGDLIRINARLVATNTGRTVSAAAVTIPRTNAINDLIRQPVSMGPTCGPRGGKGGGRTQVVQPTTPGGSAMPPLAQNQFSSGGLAFSVQSVSRSANKKRVSVVIALQNTTDKPLYAMFIAPRPILTDNTGVRMGIADVAGVSYCFWNTKENWTDDRSWCSAQRNMFTEISPGPPVNTSLIFEATKSKAEDNEGEELLEGDLVSFSSSAMLRSEFKDAHGARIIPISIPNIPLMDR